jgi:hypothetical protein
MKYNNLLEAVKRRDNAEKMERIAGRVGMDLRFKGYENINRVLTTKASQINGKFGNMKYMPIIAKSRPYLNYDEAFDPTILNAVRNTYVNVSGLNIPIKNLKNSNFVTTTKPFIPVGVVA